MTLVVTKPVVVPKPTVPLYRDPFHPVLKTPNPLAVNAEQELYLREILDLCSSDSKFAQKAYIAILALLTASIPEVLPPVVTSVNPSTGEIGLVPVSIQVFGSDFDSTSKVLWDGTVLDSTMYMSATELNAQLFMEDKVAGVFQIAVDKGGVISNTIPFTVTDPLVEGLKKEAPSHKVMTDKGPEVKGPVSPVKK